MTRGRIQPYYLRQRTEPVLVQDFSSLTGLTIGGNPTQASISSAHTTVGAGSLLLEASGSAVATVDFTIPTTYFTPDQPVGFLLKCFEPTTWNGSSILMYCSSTSVFTGGTWASGTLLPQDGLQDQATFRTGWNFVRATRATFTGGTPSALDNPATGFTTIRLRLEIGRGPIYLDSLYLVGAGNPIIQIQFDDGADNLVTTNATTDSVFGSGISPAAYLRSLGLKATVNLVSNYVNVAGSVPGYMSPAQLDVLYSTYGWDIANHTRTHTALTSLSDAQTIAELAHCDSLLQTYGWERGRGHFVYPTGAFTVDYHPAFIQSLGFKSARSIQTVLKNDSFNPVNMYNWWLQGTSVGAGAASSAALNSFIDATITAGGMQGVYFHSLGPADVSTTTWSYVNFKAVVDHIYALQKQGLCTVKTVSEWYNGLRYPGR